MNDMKRSADSADLRTIAAPVDHLSLYNRYGAMAYGIILKIIPQESVAQQVLVDVFSSPELQYCYSHTGSSLACVIKVTRAKAFEAKGNEATNATGLSDVVGKADNVSPELLFNLSFHQGFALDTIAQQVGMSKPDILRAIREHVKSFR